MLRPIGLVDTHMECHSLAETVPVLTDLLAFKKTAERPGECTLKHPNTDWLLIVHEGGRDAPAKQMHNHWGVRVASKQEVDGAHRYLTENRQRYGLRQIGQPLYNHGSYSLYFLEPGTNGWEIECYEDVLRKESGWKRNGGVFAPHWETPLSEARFPGRGYVPQAFTHGTLACGDVNISRDFYARVMGMEVHRANERVAYIKHPRTKCYVVCAMREQWKPFSPSFRFTVALESPGAVAEAHQWIARSGAELGVSELGELRKDGAGSSFLLSDPDRNWWEVCSN